MSGVLFRNRLVGFNGLCLFVDTGLFIGSDGKQSRGTSIDWPAPPEDIGN